MAAASALSRALAIQSLIERRPRLRKVMLMFCKSISNPNTPRNAYQNHGYLPTTFCNMPGVEPVPVASSAGLLTGAEGEWGLDSKKEGVCAGVWVARTHNVVAGLPTPTRNRYRPDVRPFEQQH